MAALVVAFMPQMALGATTGKLFSTNLVGTTELCVGVSSSLTFQITNTSTQKITMGSANISIPSSLAVTGVTSSVTTSTRNSNWTASYNSLQRQIEVRSAKNSDGVPQNGWARVTFQVTASGPATTWIWGQASETPGSNANVFVKQSNSFSGSGNDLLPDTRSGATLATLTVKSCGDLKVEKSSNPEDDVTINDFVAYSVKVTNKQGSAATTGVVLTDTLPSNRQGVSAPRCFVGGAEQVPCSGLTTGDTLTWNIGNLGVNGTAELRYRVQAPAVAGQLVNVASVTSNDEAFTHPSACPTSPTSDNCASITLPVVVRDDETNRSSYLCSDPDATCTNELNVTGENSTGKFVLQSGEGSFSLSSTECGDSCKGSEFEIVPNCEVDCRGLLILEYDHILGPRASNTIYPGPNAVAKPDIEGLPANCGPEPECYWIHYKPDNDAKYDQSPWVKDDDGFIPVEKCTTNGVSGSQSSAGYSNPPGTINDVDSVIPCVWKYFDPGSSSKLQIQVVIDKEDPRLRV